MVCASCAVSGEGALCANAVGASVAPRSRLNDSVMAGFFTTYSFPIDFTKTDCFPSVTRRIGVVAAGGPVRRAICCGRADCCGSRVPGAAAERGAACDARVGKRRERPADDVDENGSGTVAAGQVAFQHVHVEYQTVAIEL